MLRTPMYLLFPNVKDLVSTTQLFPKAAVLSKCLKLSTSTVQGKEESFQTALEEKPHP